MKISQSKATWIVLLFSILFLWIGNRYATVHALHITVSDYESEMNDQVFAKVTKIDSITPSQTDSGINVIKFTCTITTGEKKGQLFMLPKTHIRTMRPCRRRSIQTTKLFLANCLETA